MKTNLFKVREKKEKKIIIEEEKYKNPFIIFFLRYKSFILMSIGLILVCIMLISVGLAFSLFGSSSDFDITYIEGDGVVKPNADPDIKDDDVMEELTGTGTEGVVILVDRFMTKAGDIVIFFSDGTAIVFQADGNIYKVFPTSEGQYGIDRDGNFVDGSIKGRVTSRTDTLSDNTIITYYSDGTAQIEHNNIIIYARDSDKIESNNSSFYEVLPSGVSMESSNSNKNGLNVIEFSDGSYMIINGNNKYIVNKNTEVKVDDDVYYDKQNAFATIGEKKLTDNNTVTYFEDGSAVITDENGKNIYVNKSGDIVIKENKIFEIVTNNKGYSTYDKRCPDGTLVTYYDNGAAVITNVGGVKTYIEDSGDIIYDDNGNILEILDKVRTVISSGKMETGESVTNFDNGKSQIINKDGTSYITDSTNIKLVDDNENLETPGNNDPDDGSGIGSGTGGGTVDTSGIYVSDAENTYNYSKSIEATSFIIRNKDSSSRRFRIVIEEVNDYSKYNTVRLDPKFVKFQAVIGGDYVSSTRLDSNVWNDSDGSVNYVIYDGDVKAKSTVSVSLSLYVDYAELDNSYQNKGFIGTIKVYLITD